MLDNGLQALLISDYSGPAASEDEDEDEDGGEEEHDYESGDEMEEESEEEDDNEKGSDYDDDDEGKKKKGSAEKQVLIFNLVLSSLLSRLVKNVSEEGRNHVKSHVEAQTGNYLYCCYKYFNTTKTL